MKDSDFINPSDDIAKRFSQEALEEASKDFFELFISMFSEARRIAVEECGKDIDFQINSGAWQRGKWAILTKRRRHPGTWLSILRYANLLIPIAVGYGLAEVATRYWLVIVSIVVLAITFLLQERLEAAR
jgi:hypothetical protein